MVLSDVGYSSILVGQESLELAQNKVQQAIKVIGGDIAEIQRLNRQLAQKLAQDPELLKSFESNDRDALATLLKGVIAARGLVGFITIADGSGRVFYSSDTPAKFGDQISNKSKVIARAYTTEGSWSGYASFSPNYLTLSSVSPFFKAGNLRGVVVVSQPLNSEFLIGEARKLALLPNYVGGVDLLLLRTSDSHVQEITSDLLTENNKFVGELNILGVKAIPQSGNDWLGSFFRRKQGFERDGRWWSVQDLNVRFNINEPPAEEVGVILVTAPISGAGAKIVNNVTLYAVTGALAMLIALLLAGRISNNINRQIRILKKRATDVAAPNAALPPLSGLTGEWLELGDKIDGAALTFRSMIQSLKSQLTQASSDREDKTQESRITDSQFDTLNRKVATQAGQLTDFAKQLATINRQTILLQNKLNAVLQSSTEGFLILDQYGNVLTANNVILNWLGATEAEIAGRFCFDLVRKPGEQPPNDAQVRVFVKQGGSANDLVSQFYAEGVVFHRERSTVVEVLAHLQPIAYDQADVQGYVMVLRDKSLRRELAQLRSEIVAMLSESIRNPIVSAEIRWSNILRSAPETMHPSVGQSLADLHREYENLLGVVDSLLLIYGGVMAAPLWELEAFPIQRLVAECQEEFGQLVRERQLSFDYKGVAGLPNVSTDRPTLKATISQLVAKAIDITAAGGRIRIEAQAKGEELRIAVTSSGPALPDQEINDMFVGFVPGKHAEDTYSARLSMYLAGNNIERLGGKIWAESQAGRGTAIFIVLPLSR
jgi:signal transduction histidine kinase